MSAVMLIHLAAVFGIFALQVPVPAPPPTAAEPDPFAGSLKPCWFLPGRVLRVASDNDRELYLQLDQGRLRKIRPDNADTIWETDLGKNIETDIVFRKETLGLVASIEKKGENTPLVYKELSRETGIVNKSLLVNKNEINPTSVLDASILLSRSSDNSFVVLIDEKGAVWVQDIPFRKKIEIVTESPGDTLLRIRGAETGRHFPENTERIYYTSRGVIFTGDDLGRVYLSGAEDKTWRQVLRAGGKITGFVETSRGLLITSLDNFVYLVSTNKGGLIWKKRLSGRIYHSPVVYMDRVFVYPVDAGKLYILDLLSGGVINFVNLPEGQRISADPFVQNPSALFLPVTGGIFRFSADGCPGGN